MKQVVKALFVMAACFFALPFAAQRAYATSYVDFACGGSSCSGTVTNSGGVYSSTGIGGLVDTVSGGPDYSTGAFSLAFNTSTDAISLTGNSAAGGDTLLGSIVGASPTSTSGQTLLALTVNWTTLPTDFSSYLGSSTGNSVGSVIYLTSTGAATSIDFTVSSTPTSTPEPATALLLATGLLGMLSLRRKTFDAA
jgi:hypothetical protein